VSAACAWTARRFWAEAGNWFNTAEVTDSPILADDPLADVIAVSPVGIANAASTSAGAVIDLARPLLDAQRIVGDGADRHESLSGEAAAQRRGDFAAVADDADVEIIADAVGLGAFEDEILQQTIDGVGDALGLLFVGLSAERLQHGTGVIDEEDETGGHHAGNVRFNNIHEVGPIMWVPLAILAVLSIIGGFVGSLAIFGASNWHPLSGFLGTRAPAIEPSLAISWTSTGLSLGLAIVGILAAYALYRRGFAYKENKSPLYQLVLNKYYVDEGLTLLLINPILAFARAAARCLEGDALDGGARGFAFLFRGTSASLRRLQTGYMRNYALAILLGAVLIVVYFAVRG